MIAEIGLYTLILAFCLAIAQAVLPMAGSYLGARRWMQMAGPLALLQGMMLVLSFTALTLCFVIDDFSVSYVARNSNTALPLYYKISAVWGAHEGSLLLWALVLSLWTSALVFSSRALPLVMRARVLAVLGAVAAGFLSFMLFTSNPFLRDLPFYPSEGGDLNPLLQDIGLIIHPPLLYCGYVGFAVPFAFAIAALLEGSVAPQWTRWVRRWVNAAWAFLTIGIALGSWWAYYELGWGGWWFWDPVENASFMPWLAGTALLHALAVTEKRGLLVSWTLLLAIFAFSLSLLGTFLVRSGVLTSVHAFASDPSRGYFILAFLAAVVGSSLTLYAVRAPVVAGKPYGFFSREMFILLNSCLLVLVLAVVFLGTLYPLVADALQWGKISVGPPYFNRFFEPLSAVILLLLPLGASFNWGGDSRVAVLLRAHLAPVSLSLLLAPALLWALSLVIDLRSVAAAWLALWVVVSMLFDLRLKLRNARSLWHGLSVLRAGYWGMTLAHAGLALAVLGIALVSWQSEQRDVRMAPGDSVTLAGYTFRFERLQADVGPNYTVQQGVFTVTAPGGSSHTVQPEKRRYLASRRVMTEAGITPGFARDLYISLGEALEPARGDAGAWSVRVHVKPLVRWIWLGAILMAAGAAIAALDRRLRRRIGHTEQALSSPAQP